MSHKERIFQDKCHKCVTRIPIIEERRDGPSNTNTLCHHSNKKQSEYFDMCQIINLGYPDPLPLYWCSRALDYQII